VTGGTSGVGLGCVKALLRRGAKVYVLARNEARAKNVMVKLQEDQETSRGTMVYMKLDLGSFQSIEEFYKGFKQKESHLDLLFNCAGIASYKGGTSPSGLEVHMAVNALGPYYLTQLLIPLLEASAKKNPARPPRVCFTASIMHRLATRKGFDPQDPSGKQIRFRVLPDFLQAYSNSKVCIC